VGLGHDFLRHVERTKVLIHLLDASGLEGRDPLEDFDKINEELRLYSEKLANKPQVVACNKMDIPAARENYARVAETLSRRGYEVFAISAATRDGIAPLMDRVFNLLESTKDEEPVEEITDLMYHINTEDKPFTARKENGVFIVEGKLIEQLLASVNLDDNDSIKYFQKVLRKRGIVDELRQLGVKDGDTIRMLDLEFEYFE